jgi:hypothetical protein
MGLGQLATPDVALHGVGQLEQRKGAGDIAGGAFDVLRDFLTGDAGGEQGGEALGSLAKMLLWC